MKHRSNQQETRAYLEPNSDYMQKPIGGRSLLAFSTTKSMLKNCRGRGRYFKRLPLYRKAGMDFFPSFETWKVSNLSLNCFRDGYHRPVIRTFTFDRVDGA
jgi:hypothetical protein